MKWYMHIFAGVVIGFGAMLARLLPFYDPKVWITLLFASLLPDLDHPKSLIRKLSDIFFGTLFLLALGGSVVKVMTNLTPILALSAFYFILTRLVLFKHRGLSHHPLTAFLASVPLAVISFNLSTAFLLGYLSHLLLDRVIR